MSNSIEYKGRNYKAYVFEKCGKFGERFTVATVHIGRHEVLLTYRLGAWYNVN